MGIRRIIGLLAALLCCLLAVLSGCGGGGQHAPLPPPVPPTFTSTPATAATEGSAYSYQASASDPAGGAVVYTLSSSPAGAVLSGNTVTWTPSGSQSRQPNQFILKATTAAGGTSTQSWTVTPAGTVRVTWVDTQWTADGPVAAPHDWTTLANQNVLTVPHDGSDDYYYGVGRSDGYLEFKDVPAGYYWLSASMRGEMYWTSSSDVDLGSDSNVRSVTLNADPVEATTEFNLHMTGFDQVAGATMSVDFSGGNGFMFWWSDGSSAGNLPFPISVRSTTQWENVKWGTVLEYKPAQLGPLSGTVLDAAALLSNLSLTTGATNDIDIALVSQPEKTIDLSVKGSAWKALFDHVAPGQVTPWSTPFSLSTVKYMPEANGRVPMVIDDILLAAPNALPRDSSILPFPVRTFVGCDFGLNNTLPFAVPVVLEDVSTGTLSYHDPLPASWRRYFQLCQQATIEIPTADGTSTQKARVTNGVVTSNPSSPVVPLVGPVENPTINGQSIFSPGTLVGPNYTLTWDKPSLGNPNGYVVSVITIDQRFSQPVYRSAGMLYTTKTSLRLPVTIKSGSTYWFVITALMTGNEDMEKAPKRRSLPMANADVMSAAMTIQ